MSDQLSDVEEAQRRAIGTVEGRFHRRAVKLKGFDIELFELYRDDFLDLLDDQNLVAELRRFQQLEVDAGYRCAITLEGNAEVLTDSELPDALAAITSQYFLVDVLHLVGIALHIPRTNAASINPWMVHVAGTVPLTPILSTAALRAVAGTGTYARLRAGEGDSDVANAVCALAMNPEHAKALKPFLTSLLYEVLHTYNACGNVDTVDVDAHPALLAATICYLLGQQREGTPMQDWLDAALLTLREFYPRFGDSRESYTAELFARPEFAVVTASSELRTKCECTSKPIALALAWENVVPLDISKRTALAERVVAEWVGRVVGSHRLVSHWFELKTPKLRIYDQPKQYALNKIQEMGVYEWFSPQEIQEGVPISMVKSYVESSVHIEHQGIDVKGERLRTSCSDGAVSLSTVEQFVRRMVRDPNWEFGEKDMLRFLLHAVNNPRSIRRAKQPILSYEEAVAELEESLKVEAKVRYIRRVLNGC